METYYYGDRARAAIKLKLTLGDRARAAIELTLGERRTQQSRRQQV